jgi:hypothetical protein
MENRLVPKAHRAGSVSDLEREPRWPKPEYDRTADEPHFLFLVTPPFSGSTAVARILTTSPEATALHETCEGQWLVPGLSEADRWDPGKRVDYKSVKAVWLHEYQKRAEVQPELKVVVEKSPPNTVRLEAIISLFKDVSFLAMNRDPYANCSSILHRHFRTSELTLIERKEKLKAIAERWIFRSKTLMGLARQYNMPVVSYESFCENPAYLIRFLRLPKSVIETIDFEARVNIKDYGVRGISNHNSRQIWMLSDADIEHIQEAISPHDDVIQFFGY